MSFKNTNYPSQILMMYHGNIRKSNIFKWSQHIKKHISSNIITSDLLMAFSLYYTPVNYKCLISEFPEETWDQRLFLFQETIVERFGFVRCTVDSSSASSPASGSNNDRNLAHQHQYVHLTGNMFILIPSQPCQVLLAYFTFYIL